MDSSKNFVKSQEQNNSGLWQDGLTKFIDIPESRSYDAKLKNAGNVAKVDDSTKSKLNDITTSRLRESSATRLLDNITSKFRDISSSRDSTASRSRESSVSRDQTDFVSSKLQINNNSYHEKYVLKDGKSFGQHEEIRIPGSNRIYQYVEPPIGPRKVDYPEIIVPTPSKEDSVYENLPPQLAYGQANKQTIYPLHKFDNIVQFCVKEHYFADTKDLKDLDRSIAEKFNWLIENAKKCTKERREAEEKYAEKQSLLKEEAEKRRKIAEEHKEPSRTKRRPLSRSKTETKVPEAAEHTKKRLGFFTRKKSEVELLRKQMGQLQTDSE